MPNLSPELESLISFWIDAGVDTLFADQPIDRMAAGLEALRPRAATPRAKPAPAAAPTPPRDAGYLDPAAVAAARELAAAAGTLEALGAAIAAFDGCPLRRQGARQAVFARGAADAPVMVIGEAPGAEEDVQGVPFVGRAGRLLDRMLEAAELSERVFVTNTVFWRPPGNRTPTGAEQAACAPFLERAIALARPRVLLLAGAAATRQLLGRPEGILSLHGRWLEWTSEDGSMTLPALPTLHPSFLLRQPAAKKKAWSDLLTLAERVARPRRPT